MNEFVQACRQEWKRLRVPDMAADEMATELDVHLTEAQADGLTTAQALGPAALDPQSFAQDWAEARGVIPSARTAAKKPTSPRQRHLRGPSTPFAISGLAALVGAIIATQRPTWRHFLGFPHLRIMGSVTGQGSYWASPSVGLLKTGTLLLALGIIGLLTSSAHQLWKHAHRPATR